MATVFDISGPMAMFRKPYTTTSSVSFAFPPPTAVAGLICAIVGISNGSGRKGCAADYWKELEGTSVAVGIRKDVTWMRQSLNFWNVKTPGKNAHIQVKHQFVSKPHYRIYVSGGLEEKLNEFLSKGSFVYTPCLGTAYSLADLNYIGSFDEEEAGNLPLDVDTVVPWSDDLVLDVLRTGGAFRERVPFRMDEERTFLQACTVIYSRSGEKPIAIKERGHTDVSRCGEDLVAWFPSW